MVLNLKEIYGASWKVFAKNWISFIVFTLIAAFLGGIPFIGQFLMFAIFFAVLKSLRGETITFKDMFNFKAVFNKTTVWLTVVLVVFSILMMLDLGSLMAALVTIIVFVVGIVLFPLFCVAVDKKLGFVDTIKYSANLTKGARWDIVIVLIINFLISFVGVLLFLIGVFVALPIVIISTASVYLALEQKA